jgi:hypothetical protein
MTKSTKTPKQTEGKPQPRFTWGTDTIIRERLSSESIYIIERISRRLRQAAIHSGTKLGPINFQPQQKWHWLVQYDSQKIPSQITGHLWQPETYLPLSQAWLNLSADPNASRLQEIHQLQQSLLKADWIDFIHLTQHWSEALSAQPDDPQANLGAAYCLLWLALDGCLDHGMDIRPVLSNIAVHMAIAGRTATWQATAEWQTAAAMVDCLVTRADADLAEGRLTKAT